MSNQSEDRILGYVGTYPNGEWNNATFYEYMNIVSHNGSSYICIKEDGCTGIEPPNDNYWQPSALKGDKPVKGVDYFTTAEKEEFKAAVVAESKEEMDDYTDDKKAELDTYEGAKEAELNTYATGLKNDFDSNATAKTTTFNENVAEKTTQFNTNASAKTTAFNDNASSKTTAFNTNATNKTTDFNDNATAKTTAFDTNATNKTDEFDENASDKTDDFNDNATSKTTAFDEHVEEKTDEFDAHTEEITDSIEDLQQEVQELSQNMPWNTTEQATEISVDDAAKYSKNKLELFGNTSQDSYQGYNLVDVSPYQEETKNGVTLTKDSEGNIILNGTSTTGISFFVNLPKTKVLTAGTYTKSITKDTNIGTKLTVSIGYGGSAITGTTIQPSAGIGTMTFEQDTSYTQLRMYVAPDTTFNNFKLNYMILSGEYTAETLPDYEPYTNGASPNPDYPQPIHVVTGNNSIGVQGKNLLNTNLLTGKTSNGITYTPVYKNGVLEYVEVDGTATAVSYVDFVPTKYPIGSYILNGCPAGGQDSSYRAAMVDQTTYVQNADYGSGTIPVAITDANYNHNFVYRIRIASGYTCDKLKFYPMIRKSHINDDSYVPYVEPQNYPINLGSLELCKIGDYQDCLYKENGNWYKYGVIRKYDDFTEKTITILSTSYRVRLKSKDNLHDMVSTTNVVTLGFSRNAGVATSVSTTNPSTIRYNYGWGGLSIVYGPDTRTLIGEKTEEEFRTWLTENEIIYVVIDPTYDYIDITQITDSTLIAQLDAIYEHLQLVKGTNNITVTAEDLAPYMELTYMQDLKAKLDNLDSRLALLE